MKDIFLLLVLLTTQTTQVFSRPYEADSDGNCQNKITEYRPDGTNMCCKKCPPGHRLTKQCTVTTDSVCETCEDGLYMETWNYSPNCFRCKKCSSKKGLHYAQNCSTTLRSKCECNQGMFCVLGSSECTDCKKYKICRPGFGVSKQGTAKTDVRCEPCLHGTFSDTATYTDSCKPHTDCDGRAVVKKGNATSDNVCEPLTSTPYHDRQAVFTTVSTAATHPTTTPPIKTKPIYFTPSVLTEASSPLTPRLKSTEEPNSQLVFTVAVASSVICVLLFIPALVFLCRRTQRKDPVPLCPKTDANGNCESGNKISHSYVGESQLTSNTTTSPEHQYLLEKGEASSDHSQYSNTTETRTNGCSSHESIGPLLDTFVKDSNPESDALSEPLTLQSYTEPPPPPHSVARQTSSSQPNSPQIISPVTTSPHVNVNITLHIGNGSCGTPAFMPADVLQADSHLPFGEAEQCFCSPQQEDGKRTMMSVQESSIYSNEDTLSQTLKAI